jgi:hypothetical protein
VFAILSFDAVIIVVSLGLAFTLRARGVGHPATWGVLAGAVLMTVGWPGPEPAAPAPDAPARFG